jgi:hypothetical protein
MATAESHDEESDVDWSWTDEELDWIPPDIDTNRPSPARMYDFALGGKDNFAVDRAAVEEIAKLVPDFRDVALANRGFLIRAVDTLAQLGIDQFIDIGTGLPTSPNVHEMAQHAIPDSRIVYVDNDPIVVAHNRALRARHPGVIAIYQDLRQPSGVMGNPQVRAHLDFDRPIGLLFVAVLHFIRHDLAVEVVAQYCRALPPGSYMAISTTCAEGMESSLIDRLELVYSRSTAPMILRSASQVGQLFEGFDLLEPGLVDVTCWRAEGTPLPIRILSGVGRVR